MVETKLSARAERVEGLLALYPDIAPADTEEIVRFLKTGPHLEIGLLTARDGIGSRLQAFRRDHHRRFRLGRVTFSSSCSSRRCRWRLSAGMYGAR